MDASLPKYTGFGSSNQGKQLSPRAAFLDLCRYINEIGEIVEILTVIP